MKKAKVMFLLTAVVTMALAFAAAVYADDKVYDDLSVTSKTFYSYYKSDLGVYPVIKGMDDLNNEIESAIQNQYWNMPGYNERAFMSDRFLSSYTVENSIKTNPDGVNQYAKVTVSIRLYRSFGQGSKDEWVVESYYVNKDGMKKISKDDYDKGVKAEGEVKEEEVIEEIPGTMALKANVLLLGYGYEFSTSDGVITISPVEGDIITLTLDENAYPGDVKLSAAPVLENGVIVVPISFFTNVLGVEVEEIDGRYVIAE